MANVQSWALKNVSFARQTDLVTRNSDTGDFLRMVAEVGLPKRGRSKVDLDYAVGRAGTRKGPVVGPRQGSEFTLKFPICTFKDGYNAATEAPGANNVTPPCAVLLGNLLGSFFSNVSSDTGFLQGTGAWNEAYDDDAVVASSTTSLVKLDTGKGAGLVVGALLAIGVPSTHALRALGWISAISGDDATLLEAWSQAAVDGDSILPTATIALNSAQQVPMTMLIAGDETGFCDVAVGVVAKQLKLSGVVGEPLMAEITYGAFGDFFRDESAGGLGVPLDLWPTMSPMVGAYGGRMTVGGGEVAVQEFELTVTCELHTRRSLGALQGIAEVHTTNRKVEVAFSVARMSDETTVDGDDMYQQTYTSGGGIALTMSVGEQAGDGVALLLADLVVTDEPALKEIDGVVYNALKAEPSARLTDTPATFAKTVPRNTPMRMGWW